MGQTFHPYDPDQGHLFPPSPRDWMPEGHLAFFVSETIDELDLEPFYAKFRQRANASKHKAMSYGRMKSEDQRLKKEIERIIDLADETDRAEDVEFGPDFRGDELPQELQNRESRRAKIRAAIKVMKEEQAKKDAATNRGKGRKKQMKRANGTPPDEAQYNFTDPQSRIMKTPGGYDQCYNPQLAVEGESYLIVGTGLTANAADNGELLGLVERIESVTGKRPEKVLADSGYKSEANFRALEALDIDGYVSQGRESKRPPQPPGPDRPASQRMEHKLDQPEGRAVYRQRKGIVEPVVGWIKHVLGFRQFSFRGLDKVAAEWDLVCLSANLKRMHRLREAA
jgi:hypothetical protein